MTKVINYALGSKSYFEEEVLANHDRHFIMAKNLNSDDNYILIDPSDLPSVFGSSIELEIMHHVGNDDFSGYIFLQAFDLNKEKREMLKKIAPKVLDQSIQSFNGKMAAGYFATREDHPQTLVMLTVWESTDDLEEWFDSSVHGQLKEYTNEQLRNYTEIFKVVND